MKNILLIFGVISLLASCNNSTETTPSIPDLVKTKSQTIIEKDGQIFRDLNHNQELDIYEDQSQSIDARVEDLLSQMTVEEKAGLMFMTTTPLAISSKWPKPS